MGRKEDGRAVLREMRERRKDNEMEAQVFSPPTSVSAKPFESRHSRHRHVGYSSPLSQVGD